MQASKACTFEISGVKAPSGQSVGPNSFKYTPGSLTAATMEKATFDSTFVGLQSVSVKLTIPDAEVMSLSKFRLCKVFVADHVLKGTFDSLS